MTEPSLALQKLIRARLSASPAITALVPEANIRDSAGLPKQIPAILIGGGQVVYDELKLKAYADIHIWTEETGTIVAKTIAGTIRSALNAGPWTPDGHFCSLLRVVSTRFARDPNDENTHGVVSVEAILLERNR